MLNLLRIVTLGPKHRYDTDAEKQKPLLLGVTRGETESAPMEEKQLS